MLSHKLLQCLFAFAPTSILSFDASCYSFFFVIFLFFHSTRVQEQFACLVNFSYLLRVYPETVIYHLCRNEWKTRKLVGVGWRNQRDYNIYCIWGPVVGCAQFFLAFAIKCENNVVCHFPIKTSKALMPVKNNKK